jgi:hypothetical protein
VKPKDTQLILVIEKNGSEITLCIGDKDNYDGDLVIKQDSDTVLVPSEEAVDFAQRLLDWVKARSDA